MGDKDPFYTVRDSVNQQIEVINQHQERFQDMVKNGATQSQQFKDLQKTLRGEIRAADRDLKELTLAVTTIEKNRQKFTHIKDVELANRKKFVSDTQAVINDVKKVQNSDVVKKKIEDDIQKSKREVREEGNAASQASNERENSAFINDQRTVTKQAIAQQDKDLTILEEGLDRLNQTGKAINEEIKIQDKMLDHLGADMDDAHQRMDTVLTGLQKLLKTKDNCQIGLIVALALILIVIVCCIIWIPSSK